MAEILSLEQHADEIAQMRGELAQKEEQQEITTLIVDGQLTATGGTAAAPHTILTDTWHSLGSLAGFTVTVGRYRFTSDNCVELDIAVTGGGSNANAVTFANALPSGPPNYRPPIDRRLPLAQTGSVSALTNQWPRMFVTASSGAVEIDTPASNTLSFGTNVRIPLD